MTTLMDNQVKLTLVAVVSKDYNFCCFNFPFLYFVI